jgi:hypothetical protein
MTHPVRGRSIGSARNGQRVGEGATAPLDGRNERHPPDTTTPEAGSDGRPGGGLDGSVASSVPFQYRNRSSPSVTVTITMVSARTSSDRVGSTADHTAALASS